MSITGKDFQEVVIDKTNAKYLPITIRIVCDGYELTAPAEAISFLADLNGNQAVVISGHQMEVTPYA